MDLQEVKTADLSPDPANVRKHPERNLEAIVASLRRFGQQKPIVIDKDNVVRAGNGTLAAAKALGWDKVVCVRTDLENVEATAYAIADNRTSELAEWDQDALGEQLSALAKELDGILPATGFSQEELEALIDGEWGFDTDDVERHDGHTDGIKVKVTIRVLQEHKDDLLDAIKEYIDLNDIDADVG